jgi:hypothetical protein
VALVTGSAAWVAAVVPAMEKEGFSTYGVPLDAVHRLDEIATALPARSLGCYVQLPTTDLDRDDTASVAGLRALVAHALLARIDALASIVRLLAPRARVVIVAGDRAGTIQDTDLGLPNIAGRLAEAVLAAHGGDDVHTTVIGDRRTAADIAAIAAIATGAGHRSPGAALAGYAAVSPHLSYAGWRDEVISLAAELGNGRWPAELA